MNNFNIGNYIRVVKEAFISSRGQGPAGILILDQIGELLSPPVFFDDAKISKLVNHTINLPSEMVSMVTSQNIADQIIQGFKNNVNPDINPYMVDNVCDSLLRLINNDPNLATTYKNNLSEVFEKQDRATFLAVALVYAVGIPNIESSKYYPEIDIPYLLEANYRCPNCNRNLVIRSRGRSSYHYHISLIFKDTFDDFLKNEITSKFSPPSNVDSYENKIALCIQCYAEYEDHPEFEIFEKLYKKKRTFERARVINENMHGLDIEREIYTVLKGLEELNKDNVGSLLSLDPKMIVDKIPNDVILKDEVTKWVLKYYKFIEDQFSSIDSAGITNFNIIATQIKLAFERFDNSGDFTQREIFSILSRWLMEQIDYPEDKLGIVNIVMAFFVQNCEVFNEIS